MFFLKHKIQILNVSGRALIFVGKFALILLVSKDFNTEEFVSYGLLLSALAVSSTVIGAEFYSSW